MAMQGNGDFLRAKGAAGGEPHAARGVSSGGGVVRRGWPAGVARGQRVFCPEGAALGQRGWPWRRGGQGSQGSQGAAHCSMLPCNKVQSSLRPT